MRHFVPPYAIKILTKGAPMSLFTIADLHLSIATDHPMDVFGSRWQNYTQRIEKNWRAIVTDKDTVILPGDISWGMTLEEALPDLLFLVSTLLLTQY